MTNRRRLILNTLSLAAMAGALPGAPAMAGVDEREQALEDAFRAAETPALAGALIGRGGLVWSGVRGARRLGVQGLEGRENPDTAATTGDLWHLGSNTKAMTAMLFARLVEDGRAECDAPLPALFPDLETHAAWAEVTLGDLTAHRAGLLDESVLDLLTRTQGLHDDRPLDQQRSDLARRALAAPPSGEPGAFAYGNLNYVVAGAAIERITNAPWETAIRDALFTPLGMTSAGFGPPRGEDQPWGHQNLFGQVIPVEPERTGSDNPAYLGPAGTAHMTLEDYGRFLALFLNEGGGFVTPATLRRLTTPSAGDGYTPGGWISRADSALTGGRMLGHEGSNTMWHMTTLVAPDSGFAVIAAANDHVHGGPATQQLAAALARIGV